MNNISHVGIDYGAKYAGTTAICWQVKDGKLEVGISDKKKDADAFIKEKIGFLNPQMVFIDAPLSLPLAYYNLSDDYFYRSVDRQLKAMSPMFLGGLTARAIHLKNAFRDIVFMETYPKQLASRLNLKSHYKKDLYLFKKKFNEGSPFELPAHVKSWHEIDAVLAWLSGFRYQQGQAVKYGNLEEGMVFL